MKRLFGINAGVLLTLIPLVGAVERIQEMGLPTEGAGREAGYGSSDSSDAKLELGRMLFFDRILSGNQNIACATCHHPEFATGDGVALGFGEGASGLGPDRKPGGTIATAVHMRVPRNSPALFNLGNEEFTKLFHDGRVEADPEGFYEGGFVTPAKWKLPTGLESLLAAQAMFPVGSPTEMAGQRGENTIADAVALNNMAGPGGVWEQLGLRLQAIPDYVDRFASAFPERVQSASDVTYVLAANAIAAFETSAFRSEDSPYDLYLHGDDNALTPQARRGLELFEGKAGCVSCHSGRFQTDHEFHAIAMPQIGPGKADGSNSDYWRATGEKAFVEDFGRGRVTVMPEDEFKFRTASLRNVELTGPWGHDGAFQTLEGVVRHHLDPVSSLEKYIVPEDHLMKMPAVLELTGNSSAFTQNWLSERRLQEYLTRDRWVQDHPGLRERIAAANELRPVGLTDSEVDDLVAFLRSLTGESVESLVRLVPARVPSGLPVEN